MAELHKDILGNEIQVGAFVAAQWYNTLEVCVVEKLSSKMVRVRRVNGNSATKQKYPHDCVVLNNVDGQITMYILRNSK